jgi:hypothetical protein
MIIRHLNDVGDSVDSYFASVEKEIKKGGSKKTK